MSNEDKYQERKETFKKLFSRIKRDEKLSGWTRKKFWVGGITDIGFSREHPELLLVITESRGLFDCAALESIDRDYDNSLEWFKPELLEAKGIGKIALETIRTSGIHGGGLPVFNAQNESLKREQLDWPFAEIVFAKKACFFLHLEEGIDDYQIIFKENQFEKLKAFGFSYCGRYMVIATNGELIIYRKDEDDSDD